MLVSKKPSSIGIVAKNYSQHILSIVEKVVSCINEGAKVYIEEELAEKLGKDFEKNTFKLGKDSLELLVAIGGDGTILKIEQANSGKEIPIFGINKGVIGFLTEIEEKDIETAIAKILKGEFEIEKRIKLNVKLNGASVGDVLNDAVAMTAVPVRIQNYDIWLNEHKIDTIMADGIIVATPTGSTAYALSAGGPILDPTLDAYEIVPLSPFRLSSRAITVPVNTITKIKVASERDAVLVLDGVARFEITHDDEIEVTKSKHLAHFVKFEKNFYQKMRRKLA